MPPDASPPVSLAAAPMVGRAPELAAIAAVLDAPEGRGVLISGPIGVGKTRLATEVMGRRAAGGAVVLRVIATSATADIPLGALAAVTHLGVRAGDRREAVVERVVGDLAAAADGAPLLLVVDDVNLLDPQSHQVVRALVERRVARVVGTARTPGPPLPAPWTTPGVVHLALNDLDADGVAEVLVATLGGPVAGDMTRRLAAATEGNPLLLREALTVAGHDGSLRRVDGIWSLEDAAQPVARLGDLVGGRLAQLATDARDALELVAVGEVLPLTLAETLVGPVVLADLERSGLVLRDAVLGLPVIRPSHPFYGEALRSGLGPIARRHHARRLADAAEAMGDSGVDVLRVVAWRAAAGGQVAPDLLAQAAREARRRSEFDRAEDLASRAVDAGGGAPSLLLLGEIQNAVGRFEAADATFARVVDPVRAGAGPDGGGDEAEASLVGLSALAMAFNRAWGLGRHGDSRELLQDVSAALGRGPGAASAVVHERRAELAADAAALAAFSGAPRTAVEEARVVLASDLAPRVQARAAFALAAGLIGVGQPAAAVAASDEGLAALDALPEGFGRVTFTTNLLLTRTVGLAEAGRLDEAEVAAETTYRRSVGTAFLTGQAVSAWARGRVLEQTGRAVSGERWLREARLLERDLQTRGRRRWSLIGLGLALLAQGRTADAEEVVTTLDALDVEDPVDDRFVAGDEVRLRAALRAAHGELTAAERLLTEGAERAEGDGCVGAAVVLWHELVLAGTSRRAIGVAADHLVALGPSADGVLHEARVADAAAVRDRDLDGRLAAEEAFAAAGAARIAVVVARGVAAEAARQGQRGLARTAEERAAVTAARCEGGADQTDVAGGALAGLGPRQREVVLLAAKGLSNQVVAERLGISTRTVENHLHRAYAELGVDGRRGLTALLEPT
ncbi:AAA family ATPase [Iamia sp. SCSIO 61187]|uniref:sigma factor-like helix-turn-helix DNA-binding protein n=1 Tax=Iamia sp. SCSIO 61187 TaxID=2722752 RepID=UPI001C62B10F|nr:LuxR family transcriptional regulator [Iamia sp. SCSIO 61187]QYG93732.1 AAA family ATPase [Iamia sp. SCSIO 61187]